ncbi:MAG: hypothetical protein ACHQX4_00275 [Gemmatimonadales bacterium]
MKPLTRLVLTAASLEVCCGAFGYVAGGVYAMAAAFVGASIGAAAQILAVVLLSPAMRAGTAQFQQRWVLGMAVRFASFLLFAALLVLTKQTLPPLWMAAGYLGTLLVLLFAETRFL